ncbi:hypothetical protein DYB30_004922 [Aphanomyces astaci]|uniref:Aminotransferase class I/classII domain-containing protein n=2 Tax=Aphanomyces astaci TaxID=112090 RepID=A0A397DLS3_APHAT|nr:hypothetical protein DYB30_004922 [Aphanomyces astaci]RHZ42849.1 hypothetical protein DYB26_002052 [Aphanomyces astaci]
MDKTDDRNLTDAIHAVVYAKMPIRQATKKFAVARSTLQRRVHALMQKESVAVGADTPAEVVVATTIPSAIVDDSDMYPPFLAAPRPMEPVATNTVEPRPPVSPVEVSKGPHKVINCKLRAMQKSVSSAIDELSNDLIRQGKPVYKLGLGQSPFPIPECIVDELKAHAHQRDYLPVAGLPELRQDIATWATKKLGVSYTQDDVLVGPGTKELLFVLQTLREIATLAKKFRLLVVSDELYSDLTHEAHVSISTYYPEGTIVSGGLSKWCGAGGWRVGFWLFSSGLDWLRNAMLVMASETYTSVASPLQYAARRAFVPGYCSKFVHVLLSRFTKLVRSILYTGVAILPGSFFGRQPHELFVRIAFVDFKGEIAMYVIDSEVRRGYIWLVF